MNLKIKHENLKSKFKNWYIIENLILSNFPFSIFNLTILLQGLWKWACISIFLERFPYFMNKFHLRDILTISAKLGHFLLVKRKFSDDPTTNSLTLHLFCQKFLKSHNFQGRRVNSTVSSGTNREDKIIINLYSVSM